MLPKVTSKLDRLTLSERPKFEMNEEAIDVPEEENDENVAPNDQSLPNSSTHNVKESEKNEITSEGPFKKPLAKDDESRVSAGDACDKSESVMLPGRTGSEEQR